MGCHLTADEIYSVNHSSIKDAIVSINNGYCSGVMVSAEGLFLTNHHCGKGFVQAIVQLTKIILQMAFGQWIKPKN